MGSLHEIHKVRPLIAALEKESVKAQLSAYIDGLLREYVAKTVGVDEPPAWTWTMHWPMFYYPGNKTVYITEYTYVLGYILEPYRTKRALRWAVAHEFWHFVQDVRGEWTIRVPILSFPRVAEYIAEKQAVRLSGIGDAEGMALTREVLGVVFVHTPTFGEVQPMRCWISRSAPEQY